MAVGTHDEHSFDLDLLISGPATAIDVGCRGFSLPRFLASHGVEVWAYDVDPRVVNPGVPSVRYENTAVLGRRDFQNATRIDFRTTVGVRVTHDPAATSVVLGDYRNAQVPAISIGEAVSRARGRVGLLKLDCEGSEYAIMDELADIDGPAFRQISVEYHDHCGIMPPGGEGWFEEIAARLSRHYTIVKHHKETPPWGGRPAYVDCLYVAKDWRTPR